MQTSMASSVRPVGVCRPVARPAVAVRAAPALSTSFSTGSGSDFRGATATLSAAPTGSNATRVVTSMGNNATGGPFAPLVVVTRNVMGKKEFNMFRGKAIALHSQVIKDFCGQIGAGNKQAQGVIRLAKKNGEWLGFLA